MNREEIKNILPHREPMLLVDTIEMEGEVAHATYTIPQDAYFCQGHFPDYPVVPGVILCEIMAQSCALFLSESLEGKTPFYTGMDKVKFKHQVHPGDTVEIWATQKSAWSNKMFTFEAKSTVNGSPCCSGTLSFIILNNDER